MHKYMYILIYISYDKTHTHTHLHTHTRERTHTLTCTSTYSLRYACKYFANKGWLAYRNSSFLVHFSFMCSPRISRYIAIFTNNIFMCRPTSASACTWCGK